MFKKLNLFNSDTVKNISNCDKNAIIDMIIYWDDIVGNKLAAVTLPLKLIQHTNQDDTIRTLILQLKYNDKVQARYYKKDIIDKINKLFGENFVNCIKISRKIQHKKKDGDGDLNKNDISESALLLLPLSESDTAQLNTIRSTALRIALEKLLRYVKIENNQYNN